MCSCMCSPHMYRMPSPAATSQTWRVPVTERTKSWHAPATQFSLSTQPQSLMTLLQITRLRTDLLDCTVMTTGSLHLPTHHAIKPPTQPPPHHIPGELCFSCKKFGSSARRCHPLLLLALGKLQASPSSPVATLGAGPTDLSMRDEVTHANYLVDMGMEVSVLPCSSATTDTSPLSKLETSLHPTDCPSALMAQAPAPCN